MDLTEWLIFLHVLTAFAAVASVVVFGVTLASTREPGLITVGRRLWDVGGAGTLVLGVALAIDLDAYGIGDGWILTAFLLWAVAGAAGIRIGMVLASENDGSGTGARDGGGGVGLLYAVMAVSVAALLVVMIYKPGA